MRTIYRYEVPVDDEDHVLSLSGPIVHVAARQGFRTIEIWAEESGGPHRVDRTFCVYGTGNPRHPDRTENHVGSVIVGPFVWHLFEVIA